MEPQQVAADSIRQGAAIVVDKGGVRFHVADACGIGEQRVRAVLEAATTPSEAVRGIGKACVELGYPAARVGYALDGHDLYVSVIKGHIDTVKAPDKLKPYFDRVGQHDPTRESDLEGGRALADPLSERAGENYAMRLEPSGDDAAALVFDGPNAGRRTTQARADFSTTGNRYSGRYLADVQARQSFADGTEITAAGAVGLRPPALRDEGGGPYHEADAGISRVTSLGVFAGDGRYTDFAETLQGVSYVGHLRSANLSWLDALYASYSQRLTLTLLVGRSLQTLSAMGQELISERYTKFGASLGYARRFAVGANALQLESALGVDQGVTGPAMPGSRASGAFTALRPSWRLSYVNASNWTPLFEGSAQWTTATVPQQEQFVLGGLALHGFEPGTATGDRGASYRLALDRTGLSWGWFSAKPEAFVEYGQTGYRAPAAGQPNGTVRRADAGLELVLRFGRHLEFMGFAAEPIDKSGPSAVPGDTTRLGARLSLML